MLPEIQDRTDKVVKPRLTGEIDTAQTDVKKKKRALLGTAHGFSGTLRFRAGLWLSCFPGRVGDDMEL